MDNLEAIEILKDYHESQTCFNEIIGELDDKFCDALGLAISALEKQEGKKPKKISGSTWSKCPVCGSVFVDEYCEKCGQRIDWGDE